jgi:hypothetical protein
MIMVFRLHPSSFIPHPFLRLHPSSFILHPFIDSTAPITYIAKMMREDRFNEQRCDQERTMREHLSMPPCCGSGCAVCVLDYWTDDEFEPVRQETGNELQSDNSETAEAKSLAEIMTESQMLAMLEAVEKAQWQAQQIIAQLDGEPLL